MSQRLKPEARSIRALPPQREVRTAHNSTKGREETVRQQRPQTAKNKKILKKKYYPPTFKS